MAGWASNGPLATSNPAVPKAAAVSKNLRRWIFMAASPMDKKLTIQ
ncbi:MAG: hypothetical protein ABSA26_11815 [Thermoguttaceae bacterium]